eukprot:CAMPEP_0168412262 /NCGR_PEP_ID=MMETSP0228-20121227/28618_1 /TAXON_ID=133427 /ORGANISM="Protoceratium reticulatum, Strain CCCM 535 (=CCMP 1889)" /LENGTH=184 /DNA_ID=CAMNT_0008426019 /DNA_START=3 /DNA_END=554 /DNA_ORIENTATION=+
MAGGDLQRAADLLMGDDKKEEEEEVRAPIPAFDDQLIQQGQEQKRRKVQEAIEQDSAAMGRRMAFDRPGSGGSFQANLRAEEGAINKLFAAPDFSDARPYHEVLAASGREGRWLLVNIQQADSFASHALNRDVWSDETVRELVCGSFIFWQRDDQSAEGKQFCQYHKCGDALPRILAVDPRTGR